MGMEQKDHRDYTACTGGTNTKALKTKKVSDISYLSTFKLLTKSSPFNRYTIERDYDKKSLSSQRWMPVKLLKSIHIPYSTVNLSLLWSITPRN
jgi:hypothetical protein